MNKRNGIVLLVFAFPLLMHAQSHLVKNCNSVQFGLFYFYPENGRRAFNIIREKDIQTEIDLTTGDTTYYKIKWEGACEWKLNFFRSSMPMSDAERTFYNAHFLVVNILKVTEEFYIFKAGLDSISHPKALTDTIWFKAKVN